MERTLYAFRPLASTPCCQAGQWGGILCDSVLQTVLSLGRSQSCDEALILWTCLCRGRRGFRSGAGVGYYSFICSAACVLS